MANRTKEGKGASLTNRQRNTRRNSHSQHFRSQQRQHPSLTCPKAAGAAAVAALTPAAPAAPQPGGARTPCWLYFLRMPSIIFSSWFLGFER